MKPNVVYALVSRFFLPLGLVALLRAHLSSAAAESASPLDCKVTRLPDGSFRYQLSHSSDCLTWWEDKNKTVIARNSDQKLDQVVRSLSSQSIILKVCHEYLRYTRDCLEGLENAECKENCSSLLDQDHHPPSVNSTLTCLFGRWCPDHLTFGLGVVGVALLAAGVWALIYKCRRTQQRRRSSAEPVSYSHVPQQVKRPEPEGVEAV